MWKKMVFVLSLGLTLPLGCDDDSSNNNTNNINNTSNTVAMPELRCQSDPSDDIAFTEVTDEVGIGAEGLHLLGNRLGAVDLNGDGYPDILAHKTTGGVRDATDVEEYQRGKHVLLNEADPVNPDRRIFVDHTEASGYDLIPGSGERGRGASWAIAGDFNNDGHVDLLAGVYGELGQDTVVDRTTVLLGDGQGHFTPQGGTEPFNDSNMYSNVSGTLIDYDRDSLLDIFLGYYYSSYGVSPQQDRLYKNAHVLGMYQDVTYFTGLETFVGGAAEALDHKPTWGVTACDVNADGWTDLITSNYGRAYNMLWLSSGGETFENHTLSSGLGADDLMDYSDNQFYVCHCVLGGGTECDDVPAGTQLITCTDDYWNVGYDDQPWRNGGNTGTSVCADINNDGFMDVYHADITHWHIGSSSDLSQLMLNNGDQPTTFTRPDIADIGLDRVHESADWNQGDIYAMAVDLDNDGYLDIIVGDTDYPGTKLRIFRQMGDGTFEECAEELGIYAPRASGITYLDYDQDGDYDLLVGFSTMRCTTSDTDCIFTEPRVRLFRNDGGSAQNRVTFTLSGTGVYGGSNSLAIGAVVRVTAGGMTQTRELQSGFGHNAIQTPLEISVGLGDACVADRVEISWPNQNRTVTVLENVPANYRYSIAENDGVTGFTPLPVQ